MILNEKDLDRLINKGNHLITGSPGSGKTHTLIQLVKYLINQKHIDPGEILIFSFNRTWSKILRERTAAAIGRSIWEIPIETFYSFCIDLLEWKELEEYKRGLDREEFGETAAYDPGKGINVLNSVEQWDLLTRVVKNLDRKDYPYSYRYVNSSAHVSGSFLQEIFDFILRAQENLLEPKVLLKRFRPEKHPLLAELSGIYSRYSQILTERGEYNYGMILLKAAELLNKDTVVRKYVRDKYKYIIVDEFQETNTAQFRIISNIGKNNCIFFGNDDQSIYGFRGAVTDNFKQLYGTLRGHDKVFFLNKNHRSTNAIIELADRFIEMNEIRIAKKNTACNNGVNDGEVEVRSFSTVIDETGYICEKIKQLRDICSVRLEDMAILVKGLGYETHLIEDALTGSGIPFVRRNSRSLIDNRYISNIIDFLKLAAAVPAEGEDNKNNPKDRQSATRIKGLLENVLLSGIAGIDPLFYSGLKSSYKEAGGEKSGISFWTYINQYLDGDSNNIRKQDRLFKNRLSGVINRIKHYSEKTDESILDFLLDFLHDPIVGLFKSSGTYPEQGASERSIYISIGDYLKSVMEYVRGSTDTGVKSYLEFIENLEVNQFLEEIEESTEEQLQPGMVNILSFHQCKGMEYDAVFIPFINSSYLPSGFKNQQVFDIQLFRTLAGGKKLTPAEIRKEHMSGEVRLFYNGLTRAKKYLYITSCRAKGRSVFFERLKGLRESIKEISDVPVINRKVRPGTDEGREWMLKKKSLVALFRLEHGLKTDRKRIPASFYRLNSLYPPEKWWGYIKTTVNDSLPRDLIKSPFSYTGLETFRDCPFKYKVRYFFGISGEESTTLTIGKSYHEILQKFFNSREDDYHWERLGNIIDEVFKKQDFEFPSLKQEILSRAISDFGRYFQKYLPLKPHLSIMEKDFGFKLKNFNIKGRIDQINRNPDGSMELVDFKSGSARYSDRDLADEIQLKLYRLAVEEDRNLKKMAHGRIMMKYISLGAEKKGDYFLPDDLFDREQITAIINDIASRIANEDFRAEPKGYMTCSNCDYQLLCPRFYGKYD